MKIGIIGSSGKVGRQCLISLFLGGGFPNIELVLYSREPNRLKGFLTDLESTIPISTASKSSTRSLSRVRITNSIADLSGSNLIVVLLGRWPTQNLKRQFNDIDPSGRLAQSYENFRPITKIARKLAQHAGDAAVLVVTNQSDMMAAVVRDVYIGGPVLGLGGSVDSARFRLLFCKALEQSFPDRSFDICAISGHVIAYHNDDMSYLRSSVNSGIEGLKFRDWRDSADTAIALTRLYGRTVSNLQRDRRHPSVDTGATVLPGHSIAQFVMSFSGFQKPIEESFNIMPTEQISSRYGVLKDEGVSLPARVSYNSVEPVLYEVHSDEKKHLLAAQERIKKSVQRLKMLHATERSKHTLHDVVSLIKTDLIEGD